MRVDVSKKYDTKVQLKFNYSIFNFIKNLYINSYIIQATSIIIKNESY